MRVALNGNRGQRVFAGETGAQRDASPGRRGGALCATGYSVVGHVGLSLRAQRASETCSVKPVNEHV